MNKLLFRHIDNSALIVFRILFGLLISLECIGAIFTGWIRKTLVAPQFTFSFIGFEWLQPLPGNGMYFYYAFMGVLGVFVMVGYKYRYSMITFTLLWTASYLMQKSSYNNHYYLLCLLSAIMIFVPAEANYSIDSKQNPTIKTNSMPRWCALIFIAQMTIVYTFGAVAKLYPDWLDGTFMRIIMEGKSHYAVIGPLLQKPSTHLFLAYGGILFDGLISPLLLWKRTRNLALMASIFFHIFNAIVFQVGIFPFLSLAFILFYYPTKTIHHIFLKKKPYYTDNEVKIPNHRPIIVWSFLVYFSIQLALPLRHWFISDNVLWTEEAHRLSWRMMLRSKTGISNFKVLDIQTGVEIPIDLKTYLSQKQIRILGTKPDVIWQFAQHLKQDYAKRGRAVKVYANTYVSVNGRQYEPLIDPSVDLANTPWLFFEHNAWILPSPESLKVMNLKLPKE